MNIFLLLIWVMAAAYGLLILVYRYGWTTLPLPPGKPSADFHTAVTVIVPARNEAACILDCLEAILRQDYPARLLEIIVVNDHSTDETAALVSTLPVRLIHLADHLPPGRPVTAYKKKAIETAIGLAKGELIVTTDADCSMGPGWVAAIVQCYEQEHCRFIASPVAFRPDRSFFSSFQALDFMTMQGITGAVIRLKMGTMCNGANLAYEKKAFHEVGGYTGIDHIASGDDMLLMYKMYKTYPDGIRFLKSSDAIVHTLPAATFGDFMQQRIRWASKANKYDDKRLTAVLAFVYLWNLLFPVLLVMGFFHPVYWWYFSGLLVWKTVTELIFLWPVARFFGQRELLWKFFPCQFLHIPYIIAAGWLGALGSYQWKGRRVK